MFMTAETLDDLLVKVYRRLLRGKSSINPTQGTCTELFGALLQIKNPRARLSRTEQRGTFFSCLGEFLWYLSGSDRLDFIEYYIPRYDKSSDDGSTIFGAYGPRLFNMRGVNQVKSVVEQLKRERDTRRAVIQLFNAEDLASNLKKRRKDLPCTCTLQFTVRSHQLHMFVTMRSNDAYIGLPHDVFAFTMLQEIIARTVGVELGTYKHAVGSLHLYSRNTEGATRYVDEGLQERIAMPAMPVGNPWKPLAALSKAEGTIRASKTPRFEKLDPYWGDLIRLLLIFRQLKNEQPTSAKSIVALKKQMQSSIYDTYIRQRKRHMSTAQGESADLFNPSELDAGMDAIGSDSVD